jgi:hypothetical protein
MMVIFFAVFLQLQPVIFPSVKGDSHRRRRQTNSGWKVIPDIQPVNLEGKLNELEAKGYAVDRERNIAVVGTSFTLIFSSDEWSPEVDEDGAEK